VAASAVPAGQEIHNTYGEHSNAELLRKYGFALPANPFDSVTLPPDALVGRAAAALGAAGGGEREARRRVRWLRGHRWEVQR
jgi:SET domain-containing protein 6